MKYSTGGDKSKYDARTFSYLPTTANNKGGTRYAPKFIDNQHRVGICTSISLTQNAHNATGVEYSPDFQYLIQKKYIDGNWTEGSSALSACKAAHKYGMVKYKDFKNFIDEDDRKLTYRQYIKKLQAISDEDIEKLLENAVKIEGYAKTPVNRNILANAINNNESGLLTRFVIGNEWYRKPYEPLLPAKNPISGHLVNLTNYVGNSFRIANSWGTDWADKGTAYFMLQDNTPTEAYAVFYKKIPKEVNKKETLNKVIKISQIMKLIDLLKRLGLI